MSIHVLSWVLKHSDARLGARLVLLVLADHADEEGRHAYPSVDTIGQQARLSRRAVQGALRSLAQDGHIAEAGVSRYGTKSYDVRIRPWDGGAESAPAPSGADDDDGGRNPRHEGGAASAPDPSSNPSKEPGDISDDPALAVFDEWRHLTGRTEGTQFTPKRRTAVEARLRERPVMYGDRLSEVRTAVAFVAGSKWHRDNGHTELAVICRNPEQIEGYLQRHEAAKGRSAPSSTMSQYDQAIQ